MDTETLNFKVTTAFKKSKVVEFDVPHIVTY